MVPLRVLIAGITGGIGSSLARRLHRAGHTVGGFARQEDRLVGLASELPGLHTWVADARRPEETERVVGEAVGAWGRLDAYVHGVGSILLKSAHLTQPAEWDDVILTNLTSAFHGLRAALRPMQAQNGGVIVLISSVAAKVGLPSHEAIAAAKGGIEGLVRAAAASYAARSIRVNAVAPGLVDTPLAAPLLATEQARTMSDRMHPLGRVGRPDNVSGLIEWLLTPEADWVTGQIWSVDGGMADVRPRPKA